MQKGVLDVGFYPVLLSPEGQDPPSKDLGGQRCTIKVYEEVHTVSNKTVPITNPNTVREAHCNHTWEFRLALV